MSAPFHQALSERCLSWAVGIPAGQKVYPADVAMIFPVAGHGRPRQHHIPDSKSVAAEKVLAEQLWKQVSWRRGGDRAFCCPSFSRGRRSDPAHSRYGRSAPARRGSLAGRRASLDRRAQILPLNLRADTPIRMQRSLFKSVTSSAIR